METYSRRLSNVFLIYISCMAIAGIANMSTIWFKNPSPVADLKKIWPYEFKIFKPLAADNVKFIVTLDFDLRSAFNWNTKQLFLYLTAFYETDKWQQNNVVVWTEIIENVEDAYKKNYSINAILQDASKSLKNTNVTLSLDYRYIPLIGPMTYHHVGKSSLTVPEKRQQFIPY